MNQRIIYPTSENGIAVITPTGELSVEQVAKKDVPKDTPYLIITTDDLPSDRDFRNAWESDFSNPDGYGLGTDAWFALQESNETSNNIPQEL